MKLQSKSIQMSMLSHLVGSSNRADIARLSELEFELADAMEKQVFDPENQKNQPIA